MITKAPKIKQGKTLLDYAIEHKCSSIDDVVKLVKGKRFKTSDKNRSGHNYPKNFILEDIHPSWHGAAIAKNSSYTFKVKGNALYNNSIHLDELVFDIIRVEELKADVTFLEEAKNNLQRQIEICEELGIEEYEEQLITTIVAIEKLKLSKATDKVQEAKDLIAMLTA